jgi:peptidoglycan/LPS O-acetylase OafA/YrhL
VFTKKVVSCQENQYKNLFKVLGLKLIRLYPLYIVVLIIYWGVSPSLHVGPVWYVYQEEAQVCSTAWWRVLLLIDNWFSQGCYPVLWFVQLEVQYTLTITFLFFIVYFKKPKFGFALLGIFLLSTFVLLFIFSAEMLVSVKIAIDPYT